MHRTSTTIILAWMTISTPELERNYGRDAQQYEEDKKMPYMAPFELRAKEEGIQQGLRESILNLLEIKFGPSGLAAEESLQTVEDASRLRAIFRNAAESSSLDEFRSALPEA